MLNDETNDSIYSPPKENTQPIGPGSRLRKIREARHFSLEEMAKRLHLSRERLIQIENDDYQLMGASTFAKGYLRAYASQLEIDKEEVLSILKTFDELNLASSIHHNKPELINERMEQVNPKLTRWVGFLILTAVLLGLFGYLWRSHNATSTVTGTEKATPDSPADANTTFPQNVTNIQPQANPPMPTTPTVTLSPPQLPAINTNTASPPNASTSKAPSSNKINSQSMEE